MKTKVFLGIAIRIIVLFVISIAGTFIPEHLHEFFGDVRILNRNNVYQWEYGLRHYWYNAMVTLLFILALTNVIVGIVNIVKKNYPEL